jgi:hypothetical protein
MRRSGSVLERARALVALAGFSAAATASCDVLRGSCGDDLRDEPAAVYTSGTTIGGTYQSTGWDPEELLDFPPGMGIRFVHNLGAVPATWNAYIATDRNGDGSEIVLASGEVELTGIDAEAITVRNGTCADLFLLVTASVPAP